MQVQKNISISIKHNTQKVKATITPPSSKSESNRVLIINALSGNRCDLKNLSNARDTQTMIRLLGSQENELDVIDAGTTMRFLTAYLAVSGQKKILTGTHRMCERPIKLLVDALRNLGASIDYVAQEGYPPLSINSFKKDLIKNNRIRIRGDVSSQYITALLLIAAQLPHGLVLELEGKIGSRPYIEMTLALMLHFGVSSKWENNFITIENQNYLPAAYAIESDWSAASYWYSVAALAPDTALQICGYKQHSLQGDSRIAEIMDLLGVKSTFNSTGVLLESTVAQKDFSWDFTDCPDLAQTIAVICAAKNIRCRMEGLESLRIKETDRIAALHKELSKFGSGLQEVEKDKVYDVVLQDFKVNNQVVETYKDHRMAMAFAPLAVLGNITIENPQVVEKSYPHFWEDFKECGFVI